MKRRIKAYGIKVGSWLSPKGERKRIKFYLNKKFAIEKALKNNAKLYKVIIKIKKEI